MPIGMLDTFGESLQTIHEDQELIIERDREKSEGAESEIQNGDKEENPGNAEKVLLKV